MSSTLSSKSPSSSSSWSSHPSPFPSSARKTMDEVWKDLSLFSFHHHSLSSISGATTTNTHLQDFLDPLTPTTAAASDPSPPPPILLTLNTRPNFHYLDDSLHMAARHSDLCNNAAATPAVGPYVIPPFNVLATASPLLPSSRKKRPRGSEDNPGDRRRKRLIKNRESAARSRARKQAYTNELEMEVVQLNKENERLKKLQQKLCPDPAQLPKKYTLYRTTTAPF